MDTPEEDVTDAAEAQFNSIDWESIETHYRAAQISIREIARTHGITDGAIRKRAKAEGWHRNLSDKVQEQVRSELVRTEYAIKKEVRSTHPADQPLTEREIIDVAAAAIVQVVRGHRTQIARGTALVETMMGQLMQAVTERAELEAAINDETKDDRSPDRYNKLMKAVALPTHATVMFNLANSLKILIGLERQAFNIGEETPEAPQAPSEQEGGG